MNSNFKICNVKRILSAGSQFQMNIIGQINSHLLRKPLLLVFLKKLYAPLIPQFWTSGYFPLDFKATVGSIICT